MYWHIETEIICNQTRISNEFIKVKSLLRKGLSLWEEQLSFSLNLQWGHALLWCQLWFRTIVPIFYSTKKSEGVAVKISLGYSVTKQDQLVDSLNLVRINNFSDATKSSQVCNQESYLLIYCSIICRLLILELFVNFGINFWERLRILCVCIVSLHPWKEKNRFEIVTKIH